MVSRGEKYQVRHTSFAVPRLNPMTTIRDPITVNLLPT